MNTTPASPETAKSEPDSLGALLQWIMDQRGYANLAQLSKHTTIPYATMWSWTNGSRNTQRPPRVDILKKLAADFNLSEAIVFNAAGRKFEEPQLADAELQVVHLYRELPPEDRALAEQMLRGLAERHRNQTATSRL